MATVDEAGAIVVGVRAGTPVILLVTAKRSPEQWIFPKGHVEVGETLEAAALREAKEEAGVRGRVVQRAGALSFTQDSDAYRVHYFVIATQDPGHPESGRRLLWCSYPEAIGRLTFEDSRVLLRKIWPDIKAKLPYFSPPGTSDRK